MRESVRRALMYAVMAGIALPALAQTKTEASGPCRVQTPAKPIAYTAELKTTSVQTLSDGTKITRVSKEIRARDSQQRTFSESTEQRQMFQEQVELVFGNIQDPVEDTQIDWNSQSHRANVLQLPPAAQRHGCWADASGSHRISYGDARPSVTTVPRNVSIPKVQFSPRIDAMEHQDLGTQNIMGIEAHGQRYTRTTPVGEIGNDRPIVHTQEMWLSPSIDFPVRTIVEDPQSGRQTTELVNLELAEPDLSRFQPPEGYEVERTELHQVPCENGSTPMMHLIKNQ